MTGSINMGNNEITNLAAPTGGSNASTKKYVDDLDTTLRGQITQEVFAIQGFSIKRLTLGRLIRK